METKSLSYIDFLGKKRQQLEMDGAAMKKSKILIWFFVRLAVQAVACAATGFFSESGEDPSTLTILEEETTEI